MASTGSKPDGWFHIHLTKSDSNWGLNKLQGWAILPSVLEAGQTNYGTLITEGCSKPYSRMRRQWLSHYPVLNPFPKLVNEYNCPVLWMPNPFPYICAMADKPFTGTFLNFSSSAHCSNHYIAAARVPKQHEIPARHTSRKAKTRPISQPIRKKALLLWLFIGLSCDFLAVLCFIYMQESRWNSPKPKF